MKTILVAVGLMLTIGSRAQFSIISPAVENPLTLTFPVSVVNAGSVAWNPINNLYYSCRMGSATYPLLTWSQLGVQLDYNTTGQDARGVWWNTNLNQLERNCYNTIGWAVIHLDANKYAENTYTVLFAGMLQPNSQSVGAYNPVDNEVIYYASGTYYRYNRNTGTLIGSLALTGTALTNITTNGIVYTGIAGSEIGIYDYSNKKVLLFNKSTGVFSGSSTLPATAPGSTTYGIAYTNNLFWVYKSTENSWYFYKIFDIPLPVYDIAVSGSQVANANYIEWTINADEPVAHFDVMQSADGQSFAKIATIPGASDGTKTYDYKHLTPVNGINYYKIISTDINEKEFTSDIMSIDYKSTATVSLYPNPAENLIKVNNMPEHNSFSIYNEMGQAVHMGIANADGTIAIDDLPPGSYLLMLESIPLRFVKK